MLISRESKRSSTPPKPWRTVPASLTANARLTELSMRSPQMAHIAMTNPSSMSCVVVHRRASRLCRAAAAATAPTRRHRAADGLTGAYLRSQPGAAELGTDDVSARIARPSARDDNQQQLQAPWLGCTDENEIREGKPHVQGTEERCAHLAVGIVGLPCEYRDVEWPRGRARPGAQPPSSARPARPAAGPSGERRQVSRRKRSSGPPGRGIP